VRSALVKRKPLTQRDLTRHRYKTNSTPSKLRDLNDFTLTDCGIAEASDRKAVLAAVRKAGFKPVPKTPLRRVKKQEDDDELPRVVGNAEAGTSNHSPVSPLSSSSKKRKSAATTEPLTAVEAVVRNSTAEG
jgi:hypothetical protein